MLEVSPEGHKGFAVFSRCGKHANKFPIFAQKLQEWLQSNIPLNYDHGAQPASFVSLNGFQACIFAKCTCQLRVLQFFHNSAHFFQERTITLQINGDGKILSVRCTSNKFDATAIRSSFVRSNVVPSDRHDIFERPLVYAQGIRQMLIMLLHSEVLFINHWRK